MKWQLRWGRLGPMASRHAACESCGRAFSCDLSLGGCWCKEIALSDDARARIREKFANCLCRDCLQRYASDAPPVGGGS